MTREKIDIKAGEGEAVRKQQEPGEGAWSYRPRIDITENADEFTIFADMPGTTADGITISFESRTLAIRGRVKWRQRRDTEYLTHEYGIGDFDRELVLSDVVDHDRITADYERGVLIIHLPKSEKSKPRRIPVRAA